MLTPLPEKHSYAKLVGWIIGLVVILGFIAAVALLIPQRASKPAPVSDTQPLRARPAYTEAVKTKLSASVGFQSLVSYTDSGFEPVSVSLAVGETVRFSNNSSRPLVLSVDGVTQEIGPRDFYEHTFPSVGTFEYGDESGAKGKVMVR